jgi:hypothetical protein
VVAAVVVAVEVTVAAAVVVADAAAAVEGSAGKLAHSPRVGAPICRIRLSP